MVSQREPISIVFVIWELYTIGSLKKNDFIVRAASILSSEFMQRGFATKNRFFRQYFNFYLFWIFSKSQIRVDRKVPPNTKPLCIFQSWVMRIPIVYSSHKCTLIRPTLFMWHDFVNANKCVQILAPLVWMPSVFSFLGLCMHF